MGQVGQKLPYTFGPSGWTRHPMSGQCLVPQGGRLAATSWGWPLATMLAMSGQIQARRGRARSLAATVLPSSAPVAADGLLHTHVIHGCVFLCGVRGLQGHRMPQYSGMGCARHSWCSSSHVQWRWSHLTAMHISWKRRISLSEKKSFNLIEFLTNNRHMHIFET